MQLSGPGLKTYGHPFQPFRVGKFTLRNRVKYAACSVSNFNTEDGFITELLEATGAALDLRDRYPTDGARLLDVYDVLEDPAPVGQRVVVLSGERAGLVCAESLSAQGKRVTIVEPTDRIASDVIPTFRWRHMAWVKEYGIETVTGARVEMVTRDAVTVVAKDGARRVIPADTVIAAGPRGAQQALVDALEFSGDEMYVAGDVIRPRAAHNAVREGFLAGVRI